MLPVFYSARNAEQIEELRAKLSLRPFLLEGLDDAHSGHFHTVRNILKAVREHGDVAVLRYTQQFDGVLYPHADMRVKPEEIQRTTESFPPPFARALDVAIANVRRYQEAMLSPNPEPIPAPGGQMGSYVGLKYTPLERVGLYVPGGAAAYPSTVIMTAVPAQVAGVKEICLCSPLRDGHVAAAVLVAAAKLGITEIYGIGGAQAIAAMAFGTHTIRPVDKIVGPGNIFVQLAKRELFGIVDIDSFAGPSEVIVLADDTAAPSHVAADLLAQAEHAPGSCLLITTSETLALAVQAAVEEQLKSLARQALTQTALGFASAIIVADTQDAALKLVTLFAPEHLQITTRDADADAAHIASAGAIFIGPHTPVAAGDYLAGPSHVLPTSGTARFFSGLSADSFRKRTSLVKFDAPALRANRQAIVDLAASEGFDAHAASVTIRNAP